MMRVSLYVSSAAAVATTMHSGGVTTGRASVLSRLPAAKTTFMRTLKITSRPRFSKLLPTASEAKMSCTVNSAASRVGVVGAGQMGVGIAYVAACTANIPVVLIDNCQSQLDKALKFIDNLLAKNAAKGKITAAQKLSTRERISTSTTIDALESADFVIEAAPEVLEIKQSILRDAAARVSSRGDAILATNTSSISITRIASSVPEAQRGCVIGMHFMNPVPHMPLVEIIPGLATSAKTVHRTERLAALMQKTTTMARDVPGFVANRLLMPYLNESIFAFHERLATRDDIDRTMLLGTNMPMGPLALADFIGLDTTLNILSVLHKQLGEDKYRPCPLLRTYVDAGWLGRKSGRGFYDYSIEQPPNPETASIIR